MNADRINIRNCMGHFASGVTVVAVNRQEGESTRPHGATVNLFTSVSLDPPLVLVSLDRRSKLCRMLEDRPFVINVLAAGQQDVAMHFAGKPQDDAAIEWADDSCGPRLVGALAHISCTPWRRYDGGDHVLFVGQVADFEFCGGDPLVFFRGKFERIDGLTNTALVPGDILNTPGWGGETPLFAPQEICSERAS